MTVAIIAEYNPFHAGHKYHIDEIRRAFGDDTSVIAIMSGNYTQRGEPAFADKFKRAEWACLSGVDLILELPFPYSMSSAELFARSAVSIIASLGKVDAISFGSESGSLDELIKISDNMLSEEYNNKFREFTECDELKNLGHPAISEAAYRTVFPESISDSFFRPNNILALEYIKAIKSLAPNLKIHTVKRLGADYSDEKLLQDSHASAMGIRRALAEGSNEYISHIPQEMKESFLKSLENGEFPSLEDKLSSAVISHLRLNSPELNKNIFDAGGGLYNRLRNASFDTDTISSLIACAMTKKFTNSRIRRSVYYSFFGVTSSSVKELPEYTQVLALNENGRMLLKSIKKNCGISILTKPSATSRLSKAAIRQKELADKADSVFQLTLPGHRSGVYDVLSKPFVKHS